MNLKAPVLANQTIFADTIGASYRTLYGLDERSQSVAARADLESMPIPTTKSEFWKYTRLSRLSKQPFHFSDPTGITNPKFLSIPELNSVRLAFVNGIFQPQFSDALPSGVTMTVTGRDEEFPKRFNSLAKPKKHVLEAINTAYCPEVVTLHVAANTSVAPVIQLAHWTEGEYSLNQTRLIVDVESGAKAAVMQSFNGDETTGFTNALSEFFVGENAHLTVYKVSAEKAAKFHHSSDYSRVSEGGHFEILTTPLSRAWTRNNLNIKIAGEHAFAKLNGLIFLDGNQHVDNNTYVDHTVPNCDSSELYKTVLEGKSTGVFNGKVMVRPDAQKTNAYQQNSNLILSSDAQNYSKPELEIYADDVKCSHGSTTGQIDEEAIFYLRSRAISLEDAQKMLLSAFAGEVIEQVEHKPFRDFLYQKFSM